jgi:hypothetical protein
MAIPLADEVGKILYEEQNPLFMKKFYFETAQATASPRSVAMAV